MAPSFENPARYASRDLPAVNAEVERAVIGSSKAESHPSMKIAPNFFIIGAPKSGTTALSQYLGAHPNVFFSRVKEPHFFDLDTSTRVKAGLQTYLSLFSEAEPDLHKAVGEGSTGYLFSRVAVSEILKFNPDSKFIVMVRNPVDLVQAWHSEMYYEGVEDIRDFESAWKLEEERRRGRRIPYPCWEPKKLFYSEWGKLGEQVERLFSVVARDRLKVIVFDDFIANTRSVYEQVLSFLGVPLDGKDDFETVNESRALRYPWLQRRLALTANQVRRIRAISGLNLRWGLGLSQRLLLLNSKPSPRRGISPELRAELNEFFREDVRKLSKLLGRDLSYWVAESTHAGGSQLIRER
jgi:Sulfotransferase domain